MAVSVTFYNSYKKSLGDATIDLVNDTVKMALLDETHTPNYDTHDNFDDVSTEEISSAGYTSGGTALSTKAVTQDNTGDKGVFDCDDLSWTGLTATVRYAVVYKDSGTPSTSPLICLVDLGADTALSGSNLNININASGLINFS